MVEAAALLISDRTRPAPYLSRLFAWIIDFLLIVLVMVPVPQPTLLLFLCVFVTYHTSLTWLMHATAGKALFGLKLKRVGKRKPGLLWALGRASVGYFIVDVFGAGTLIAFLNAEHRCLHDYFFGSVVAYVPSKFEGLRTFQTRFQHYVDQLRQAVGERFKTIAAFAALMEFLGKLAEKLRLIITTLTGGAGKAGAAKGSIAGALSLKASVITLAATATITGAVVATVPALRDAAKDVGNRLPPNSRLVCLESVGNDRITNGGFERVQIGPNPGKSGNPNDIPGWIHSGAGGDGLLWNSGYKDASGAATTAGCGKQFVSLGGGWGTTGLASWQTTIQNLKPGRDYVLKFLMASESDSEQSMTVTLSTGASATQTFSSPPSANYWQKWVSKELEFTPTAERATLTFAANTERDVGLDQVVVERVWGWSGAPKIKIVAATYGANCGQPHGNKTQFLAEACNGKQACSYTIDYTKIGDPAVGCQKDYSAEWRCGAETRTHTGAAAPEAGYGSSLQLSCP